MKEKKEVLFSIADFNAFYSTKTFAELKGKFTEEEQIELKLNEKYEELESQRIPQLRATLLEIEEGKETSERNKRNKRK